ncbi:BZIP domain-containing protein [Psidium guajava]|nr:BZIP domain-containing protein [Psidium guajava]
MADEGEVSSEEVKEAEYESDDPINDLIAFDDGKESEQSSTKEEKDPRELALSEGSETSDSGTNDD